MRVATSRALKYSGDCLTSRSGTAPTPGAASATRSHSCGVKPRVYLKRWLGEVNAQGWTRDPRQPGTAAAPYFPKPPSAAQVKPDANGGVPPRPRVDSGAWSPGEAAPRPEPGRQYRIGDR